MTTVQGLRGAVEQAIQRASSATGVDFGFLMKTANRESSFNPRAKAASSSAAGLFQFTDQTWLGTLKAHGAKHGYARYAQLITKGADGRFHVEGAEARQAVMELKLDPHASSLMAGELTSDHALYLRGRTGRDPTGGELYIAHFLGPQGSAKLIEAAQSRPGVSAAGLFPEAAAANHAIFYPSGRAASVGEVYANLTRGGGAGSQGRVSAPAAPVAAPDPGFIQYASARQTDRAHQQQEMLVELILRGPQSPDGTGSSIRRLTGSMFSSEMLRVLSDSRGERRG